MIPSGQSFRVDPAQQDWNTSFHQKKVCSGSMLVCGRVYGMLYQYAYIYIIIYIYIYLIKIHILLHINYTHVSLVDLSDFGINIICPGVWLATHYWKIVNRAIKLETSAIHRWQSDTKGKSPIFTISITTMLLIKPYFCLIFFVGICRLNSSIVVFSSPAKSPTITTKSNLDMQKSWWQVQLVWVSLIGKMPQESCGWSVSPFFPWDWSYHDVCKKIVQSHVQPALWSL
jgi:hypothetical protein